MKCSTVSSVVRRDFAVRHCFLPISASSSPRMIEIQTFSKPLSWLTPGIGLITIRRVSRMPTCSVDFFVKLYVRFSIASIAFEVTGLRRPPARTSVCTKRKSSHFSSAEEWLTLFLVFEDRRAPRGKSAGQAAAARQVASRVACSRCAIRTSQLQGKLPARSGPTSFSKASLSAFHGIIRFLDVFPTCSAQHAVLSQSGRSSAVSVSRLQLLLRAHRFDH